MRYILANASHLPSTLLSSAGRAQDCNCSTSSRHLEARGSIPRGETLLLHVEDMLYLLWLSCYGEIIFCGHGENFKFWRETATIWAVPVHNTTRGSKEEAWRHRKAKESMGELLGVNLTADG